MVVVAADMEHLEVVDFLVVAVVADLVFHHTDLHTDLEEVVVVVAAAKKQLLVAVAVVLVPSMKVLWEQVFEGKYQIFVQEENQVD